MVKKGDVDSSQLPPCQDILMLHAMRANYQPYMWQWCLEREKDTLSQEGHGWMIDDEQIVVDWMQDKPAPQVVMELIALKCCGVCKASECQCIANALKCLTACENQLCGIMIDGDLEDSINDTVKKMHDIQKLVFFTPRLMLADC